MYKIIITSRPIFVKPIISKMSIISKIVIKKEGTRSLAFQEFLLKIDGRFI